MRILLVEDNRELAGWLARALQKNNYKVDCAHDGASADHLLYTQTYALVVLDLALPKLDGREVLRRLRARKDNVPVLILTASSSAADCVNGLDIGADDYVSKPFDVAALEARMRALLRRSAGQRNPVVQCGSLSYDSNTREFSLSDERLALTPREHAVLEALMMKPGKTVSKHSLAETLYTLDDNVSPDAIEIYVHRLRKKMEGCDAAVVTLRGLGYLLRHEGV